MPLAVLNWEQPRTLMAAQRGSQPSPSPRPSNPSPRPSNPNPRPSNPSPVNNDPNQATPGDGTGTPASPGDPQNPNADPNDTTNPGNRVTNARITRPFLFQSPQAEARFNESSRRLASMEQKFERGNAEMLRRLGEVRSLPPERQNNALFDLLQQMLRDNAELQKYLTLSRLAWTGEPANAAPNETPRDPGDPQATPSPANQPPVQPGPGANPMPH